MPENFKIFKGHFIFKKSFVLFWLQRGVDKFIWPQNYSGVEYALTFLFDETLEP